MRTHDETKALRHYASQVRKYKQANVRIAEEEVIEPPRGFDMIAGHDQAVGSIRSRLEEVSSLMEGMEFEGHKPQVHSYKDGSVDGEISWDVGRSTDPIELARRLEEAFSTSEPDGRLWFSVGVRYVIHEDEEVYRRFKGMNDVAMYFRRMDSARGGEGKLPNKIIDSFGKLQHELIPGLHEKYGRRPQLLYLRLHWNSEDETPKR